MRSFLGIVLLLGGTALAQTTPVKPGLWEMTPGPTLMDGKPLPDMRQLMGGLQQMPPEMRSKMEAQMKAHGVSLGADGKVRSCVSAAQLEQGQWGQQQQQGSCKTQVLERSATRWRWKSVCTSPKAEGEGLAQIRGPEAYQVEMQWKSEREGRTHEMKTSATGRWLGADCGDLKPLQAR